MAPASSALPARVEMSAGGPCGMASSPRRCSTLNPWHLSGRRPASASSRAERSAAPPPPPPRFATSEAPRLELSGARFSGRRLCRRCRPAALSTRSRPTLDADWLLLCSGAGCAYASAAQYNGVASPKPPTSCRPASKMMFPSASNTIRPMSFMRMPFSRSFTL